MAENGRKKKYGQKLRRGAAILAVTAVCCGLLRLTGNAIHQMWQEVSGKMVVYAADGGAEPEDLPENEVDLQEQRSEQEDFLQPDGEGQEGRREAGIKSEEEIAEQKDDEGQGGHEFQEKDGLGETELEEANSEDNTGKKEKTMYLTFDDGPTAENTVSVLDTLKKKNIKATFFVVGENVEKHPEVARRIVEDGHTIGIHCYSHDYKEIYASVDSYLADFEKAYNVVYEVTGVKAQLFRFPGGSINAYNKGVYKDIIAAMTERGYTYFDWNASLEDAVTKSTPESLLANAKETTLDRKKVVMLCHDTVYNTTLCLGELIEQFPEYRMEPLTPEVAPIQF